MKRREFIAASVALLFSPRRSLAQGTRRLSIIGAFYGRLLGPFVSSDNHYVLAI